MTIDLVANGMHIKLRLMQHYTLHVGIGEPVECCYYNAMKYNIMHRLSRTSRE
jgi:hypothetical protein